VYTGCAGPAPVACGCAGGGRVGLFGRHHNRNNGCAGVAVNNCCAPVAVGCAGGVGMPGPGYGPGYPGPGGVIPAPPPKEMPKEKKKDEKKETIPPPKGGVSTPATLVVTLPVDATLSVDGYVTTSTSGTRVLVTPALEAGSEYTYSLTASVVRDGQTVTQTQRIAVRPGEQTAVPFSFAPSSQAVSR